LSPVEEFLNGPYGWLVIFGIIVIFTLLTILYYTKKDVYDPEPPGRLLYGFLLGIVSVFPALILSFVGIIILILVLGAAPAILQAILIAPVMEEIAKILFVVHLSKSDAFDGPLDGLIYGAMVGAGFAAAENILYGLGALLSGGIFSGLTLTVIRSVTQVVGHPLYTGLAGVGVGEWKVGLESGKYSKLWRSMLFHGLWNLAASLQPDLVSIGGIIVVIVINVYVLRKELRRCIDLDKDAYERGYYDQKEKRLEMKRNQIRQQIQSRNWEQTQNTWSTDNSWNHSTSPQMDKKISLEDTGVDSRNYEQPDRQSGFYEEPVSKSMDQAPNFCKICGTKRQEGDRFCRTCGNKLV